MDKEEKNEQEIILDEEMDKSSVLEKVKKLKEQLKQCQQAKQDNLTGWQRAQADFINYRRRQDEQMSEWSKMFGEGLIKDILPVLDALESGIKNQEANDVERITSLSARLASQSEAGRQPSPSKGEGEIFPDPPLQKEGRIGLKLLREQLIKVLGKHGLTEMKVVGEKFSPGMHEAIEMVEAEGEDESAVVEEVQKGYLLNGKMIRVAKVKVSK